MQLAFSVILAFSWTPIFAENSSIKVRADVSAFSFFSKFGKYVVDKEIPNIQIPDVTIDITGGPGTGTVSALNLKITKFKSPSFKFGLSKRGISWKSNGGTVKIDGNWQAEYTLIAPISAAGWVQAIATDIRVELTASAFADSGKPQVNILECSADIIHLGIEIGGGVLPWLVNIFRGPLSEAIRKEIHRQACEAGKTLLVQQLNEFLFHLPAHIPIGKDFFVDYSLDSTPAFTSTHVDANISADIVYGNRSCKPAPALLEDPGKQSGMATIWLSESIPNCLLSSVHSGNLAHFLVTKDMPTIGSYLRTECGLFDICIGKFFPRLRQDFPNRFVDLLFSSYEEPFIRFQNGEASANATLSVELHIHPIIDNPTILARLILGTKTGLVPVIKGTHITGLLNETRSEVTEDFSFIGDISPTFLKAFEKVFSFSSRLLIESVLRNGIPLPIYDNVTISDTSKIDVLDGVIRLNVDFVYEE